MHKRQLSPCPPPADIKPPSAPQWARQVAGAGLVAIAFCLLPGHVRAQVDVSDEKTHDKLNDVLKELQTSVTKLNFDATPLATNNELKKIEMSDLNAYRDMACPKDQSSPANAPAPAPTPAESKVKTVAVIKKENLKSVGREICMQLITLRVQAVNETVDMANRYQEYKKQLDNIDSKRGSAKTHGDIQANSNESIRTTGKLQAEMGFWRSRISAYESAIKLLENQQNALTEESVKGTKTATGTWSPIVQTLALKAALTIGN